MRVHRGLTRFFLGILTVLVPLGGYLRADQMVPAVDAMPLRWCIAVLAGVALVWSWLDRGPREHWFTLAQWVFVLNALFSSVLLPSWNGFGGSYLFSAALIYVLTGFVFERVRVIWTYLLGIAVAIGIGAMMYPSPTVSPVLVTLLFGATAIGMGFSHWDRMVRHQKTAGLLERLRVVEGQMRGILDHSIQHYFLIAPDGTLLLTDTKSLGTVAGPGARPVALGLPMRDMTPESVREAWTERFARALGGEKFAVEYGSETRWHEVRYSPWLDQEARPLGVVMTLLDVTERKKAEREILAAKTLAENAAQSKSVFLSQMSHELRTPMNAILGLTEISRTLIPPGEAKEHLDVVADSARNLLQILNDILDFSKIEAGKLDVESIPFSPRICVRGVCRSLESLATERGLELIYEEMGPLPPWVRGDPTRLGQIVTNFCSNAIKFTPAGGVTVRLSCEIEEERGQVSLQVEVEDTGMGIAPDKQGLLFDRFAQVDSSIARKFGGTGLGLAICKQLAEMQGGRVYLRSALGRGSTFGVEIPYEVTREDVRELQIEAPEHTLQGQRVLVVDDNRINLLVARKILEKEGMSVQTVLSGSEALDLVQKEAFDVILLDLHMPDMDGRETFAHLQSRGGLCAGVPVIALTADAFQDTKSALMDQGFAAFVSKPILEVQLFAALRSVCLH